MQYVTKEKIKNFFSYHPPTKNQTQKYERINEAAHELAKVIVECCPQCSDTNIAIQKLREARMMANASIACNEVGNA